MPRPLCCEDWACPAAGKTKKENQIRTMGRSLAIGYFGKTGWTAAVPASLVKMVPKGGLEPPWVAPHAPQTCVSTSSTTSALVKTRCLPRMNTDGEGSNNRVTNPRALIRVLQCPSVVEIL